MLFPLIYLSVVALTARASLPPTFSPSENELRDMRFAGVFGIIIVVTLVASLGHVVALGWLRSRFADMSVRAFLLAQIVTAVLSAWLFLQMHFELYGSAVWIGPAAITVAAHMAVKRIATSHSE